jgi:2-polyprenyl-3-methyl-5-hydroxy-6-metoxy-1,4-benzoquinol methylase
VKVLLVPSIRASMGSGHLKRALRLSNVFGPDSALLLEDFERSLASSPQALLEPLGIDPSAVRILRTFDAQERWDLVILDRLRSEVEQARRFFPVPAVGLDEGGAARRFLAYLIDTFPAHRQPHRANLTALSLLDLPSRRERFRYPFTRVLLSFGGEDPADLSGRLLALLLGKRFGEYKGSGAQLFEPAQITVVQGPYFKRDRWPQGVRVLRSPGDLKSILGEYDLVFCSFGLTAYEALAAGVPVINLNPSSYHRRLSAAARIPEIGVRRPSVRKLERLLADAGPLRDLLSRYPAERLSRPLKLSGLPARLHPSGPARCPVCARSLNPAVARFPERSFFRCRGCGILYQVAFGKESTQSVRYDRDYFFSEYGKQYGRTYLEDFQNIKAMAAARLKRIDALLHSGLNTGTGSTAAPDTAEPAAPASSAPKLLDVGCAYGPFLQAAQELGYRVQGVDISPEAVAHVRERLGIPCSLGDFSSEQGIDGIEADDREYEVITLWYVIEHFRDTAAVLERVNRLLRRGGVFAFSTPSASGVSARKSRIEFLRSSPPDHFTVWPPHAVRGVLKRFGFQLRGLVVTGHHGERFPWPGNLAPGSALASGFSAISRVLRLGDTFEGYAVKVRDLP